MFGVGMPEMVLILVVALLVFGPRRLPELARTIGRVLGQVRAASSGFQRQIEREIGMGEPPISPPGAPSNRIHPDAPPPADVADSVVPTPPSDIPPPDPENAPSRTDPPAGG